MNSLPNLAKVDLDLRKVVLFDWSDGAPNARKPLRVTYLRFVVMGNL